MTDKAEMECQTLNELFWSEPTIHWIPVAEVTYDGEKIRDLTLQEQLEWIKQEKERDLQWLKQRKEKTR